MAIANNMKSSLSVEATLLTSADVKTAVANGQKVGERAERPTVYIPMGTMDIANKQLDINKAGTSRCLVIAIPLDQDFDDIRFGQKVQLTDGSVRYPSSMLTVSAGVPKGYESPVMRFAMSDGRTKLIPIKRGLTVNLLLNTDEAEDAKVDSKVASAESTDAGANVA